MAKQEVTNFARFYTLINRIPYVGDREELKKKIVHQYTWERTEHLHEMTRKEYNACCSALEKMVPGYAHDRELYIKELKRNRSAVLHQMQIYGVDTTNWSRVDSFCSDSRIAGKRFRDLDCEELGTLLTKLRMINRKKNKEQ